MLESPQKSVRKSIKSLQVVRGTAALLVLLYHMTLTLKSAYSINFLNSFFEFGNSGVEIFFVLSGFIISYTSFHLLDTGHPYKYLVKRFARVYPIYWIIITAFFLPAILFSLNAAYEVTPANIFATYLLLPNHPMINGVSWSLSYELYFYTLFALLIINRKSLVLLVGLLVVVLLQILGSVSFENPLYNNFFFSQFVLLFFMGVAVYGVWRKEWFVPNSILSKGAILICIATYLLYAQNFHYREFSPLFYGTVTATLIFFLVSLESAINLRVPALLVLVGDASYVLYLIHLPILNFSVKLAARFTSDGTILILFQLLIATGVIIGSIIVHLTIEKPLNRYLKARLAL